MLRRAGVAAEKITAGEDTDDCIEDVRIIQEQVQIVTQPSAVWDPALESASPFMAQTPRNRGRDWHGPMLAAVA